jgi:hypothetical protein
VGNWLTPRGSVHFWLDPKMNQKDLGCEENAGRSTLGILDSFTRPGSIFFKAGKTQFQC